MKDVQFMTAKEKETVLRQWKTFLKHGCKLDHFKKALYNHLIQHASFIAHYNRLGFYDTYFVRPQDKRKFFSQFDRRRGCVSVEMGGHYWLYHPDYSDINNAMVDAAEPWLDAIYSESNCEEKARDTAAVIGIFKKYGLEWPEGALLNDVAKYIETGRKASTIAEDLMNQVGKLQQSTREMLDIVKQALALLEKYPPNDAEAIPEVAELMHAFAQHKGMDDA